MVSWGELSPFEKAQVACVGAICVVCIFGGPACWIFAGSMVLLTAAFKKF
jgi:hypothetical protein